jgi:hypothetical protein
VSAAEILFLIEEGAMGLFPGFEFGQVPFEMRSGFEETYLDGALVFDPEVRGITDFVSGPLIDLTVEYDADGNPTRSLYRYGPGTLDVTAFWNLPNGNQVEGRFVAELMNLEVRLREDCDFFGACGDVFASLRRV